MSGPDSEETAGPVVPQPPVVSNYGLLLTVYILYLVGFLTSRGLSASEPLKN
jgi:hypothetical protein